ncbi:protein-export chaperone SecB [Jannaschia sp. Os4]|uniref:protein-export chaperone SecB n=1 Tax=Jannaschia sp. Os4 TaxID=2807617 RepID=UPI00193A55B1|nr:protein-export chaperone SecB [Jannaschia sp. Os4]MBM2575543.1 protein-export chaperone SecB [Jannaschia sp. Os4]
MAENEQANGAAQPNGEAQAAPSLKVVGQFIRDLSFENVAAQKGKMASAGQPEIAVQVGLDAKKGDAEDRFEVAIKLNVKAKSSEDTIFALELDYAGLFQIGNVPQAQMHPFLLIECPRMLFPYVRRIVGDVTRDGGFPPLNLETIDFVQLYRQDLQRRAAAQQAEGAQAAN